MTTTADYKPIGRFDAGTAAAHEKSIQDLLAGEVNSLAIDLSELDFLSSAGLRVLLVAAKTAKAKGGKVVLISPKPAVLDVLKASGFDNFIQIQA
ncbi:MAG TPA: STAS domain-containing protein [Xanthobacteraceae bacterium]|jgi:anti-anti-sigma factor